MSPAGCPGLDVSAYQKWSAQDWLKAYVAGYRFAFIKACEGSSIDPMFATHWGNAKAAGFLRGAYGFVHVNRAIRPQAETLIELLADDPGELPAAIDIETSHGLTTGAITDAVCEWIDIVHQALGRRPIVYTYASFSREHLRAERLAECELWAAHYGAQSPDHAPAWKRWLFWQWTGHGTIDGIHGRVDLNVFAGTITDLREAYGVTTR